MSSPLLNSEDGTVVRAGKEFAVSAAAAAASHMLHHPLYTLKSQMMFRGPRFSFKVFVKNVLAKPYGAFLYRGKHYSALP